MVAFPFNRTEVPESDLICGSEGTASFSQLHYERRHSTDARVFKAQYFELDKRLLELFSYIAPTEANKSTHSVTLATIIRNAATLFELGSRWLYPQIFHHNGSALKIAHYLSLDRFTKASSITLRSFQFYDQFSSPQVYRPFVSLADWDQSVELSQQHIPAWWTASNKLKHTNSGLQQYGTLENAISSVGAAFAFLHTVFGPGMVFGIDVDAEGQIYPEIASSVFYI
jgi:hypothetical protein